MQRERWYSTLFSGHGLQPGAPSSSYVRTRPFEHCSRVVTSCGSRFLPPGHEMLCDVYEMPLVIEMLTASVKPTEPFEYCQFIATYAAVSDERSPVFGSNLTIPLA
eukprot:7241389-Prymnesium_polylepis.1